MIRYLLLAIFVFATLTGCRYIEEDYIEHHSCVHYGNPHRPHRHHESSVHYGEPAARSGSGVQYGAPGPQSGVQYGAPQG